MPTTTAAVTSGSAALASSSIGCAIGCAAPATPGARCSTRSGSRLVSTASSVPRTGSMKLAASLPLPPDLPACQAAARRMEELGYESVWIADTGAGPDAFVVAAAVSAVTTRLRIGTAVIPVYTRTPSVFAAAAGSVAQLAPGRFVLGIGASSETIVQSWGGVPFERPLTHV